MTPWATVLIAGVTTILSLQVCRIGSYNALKVMQEKDYVHRQEHEGLNIRKARTQAGEMA